MGYFQNSANFREATYYRNCVHCNTRFHANSPRQKKCSREDNPCCDDDIISLKKFASGRHPLLRTLNKEEKPL